MTAMRTGALGMIETRGLLGAVEAADAALKSASVSLIGVRKVGGGLVSVLLAGDVAAVRSAVDAASASLGRLNVACDAHVIPRLDAAAWRLVEAHGGDIFPMGRVQRPGGAIVVRPEAGIVAARGPADAAGVLAGAPTASPEDEQAREGIPAEAALVAEPEEVGDALRRMTVMDLRHLARSVSLNTLTRRQIRDANKDQLLLKLDAFYARVPEDSREEFREKIRQVMRKKRGDEA